MKDQHQGHSLGLILNLVAIGFMLLVSANCGIFAFLDRSSDAADAVARARQLTRNGTSLKSLNDLPTIRSWLGNTYLRSIYDTKSFLPVCSYKEFYGNEYVYGRTCRVPSFTVRILGGTESLWGCESNMFNFKSSHSVAGYKLQKAEDCPKGTVVGGDLGSVYMSTSYGLGCRTPPKWPGIFTSQCCNGICNNGTFCEAVTISAKLDEELLGSSPTVYDMMYFDETDETEPTCELNASEFKWIDLPDVVDKQLHSDTVAELKDFTSSVFPSFLHAFTSYTWKMGSMIVGHAGPQLVPSDDAGYPVLVLNANETCASQFETHGDRFVDAQSQSLVDDIMGSINLNTSALITSAYLPLGTDDKTSFVIDILNIFAFGEVASSPP